MTEKFTGSCGAALADDTDSYLKQMPFMDDIIYQNPPASNRRGYDILTSYNMMKVGPEINFHDGPVPINGIAKRAFKRKSGPIALKIEIRSVTPLVKKVPKANASAADDA